MSMQQVDTLISLQKLKTGYKVRSKEHIVSESITAELKAGELTMLMGPNGCGKSTLMQTIAGMLPPLGGTGIILDQDLSQIKDKERAKLISLVLTDRLHTMGLNVWDIVSIGRYPYIGLRAKLGLEDVHIVRQALRSCQLEGYEKREYLSLSDGEKQRVMTARALAQQTPIMLLDEPTAHLDLPSRIDTIRMLKRLARDEHKAILVSTHELELALNEAEQIWLMSRDGTLEHGSPNELILKSSFERCFGSEYVDFSDRRQALNKALP